MKVTASLDTRWNVETPAEDQHPGNGAEQPAPPAEPVRGPAPDEELRRDAVEEIMRDAAGWGYDVARMRFQTRPVPEVDWSEDGRPRIRFGTGSGEEPRRPIDMEKRQRNIEG